MLQYLKTIQNWRKNKPVIHFGDLKHFVPENGMYVYFRYDNKQSVMIVMNTDTKTRNVNMSNYAERTSAYKGGKEIISGNQIGATFSMPAMSMQVIELTK